MQPHSALECLFWLLRSECHYCIGPSVPGASLTGSRASWENVSLIIKPTTAEQGRGVLHAGENQHMCHATINLQKMGTHSVFAICLALAFFVSSFVLWRVQTQNIHIQLVKWWLINNTVSIDSINCVIVNCVLALSTTPGNQQYASIVSIFLSLIFFKACIQVLVFNGVGLNATETACLWRFSSRTTWMQSA